MNNITLLQGDCLELLPTIQDKSVDFICTDLPYGTTKNEWDAEINLDLLWKEYRRIIKDKGCIALFGQQPFTMQEMLNVATDCGFHFIKSLIWEKNIKICGTYYMGCFEYILMFRKGSYQKINSCGTPDILNIPIEKLKDENGDNFHDTEKPIALMRTLITNSSNRGDIVLDPFMGIGSTIIASKLDGRDAIGIEVDEKYFNVAKARIDETVESINFFD